MAKRVWFQPNRNSLYWACDAYPTWMIKGIWEQQPDGKLARVFVALCQGQAGCLRSSQSVRAAARIGFRKAKTNLQRVWEVQGSRSMACVASDVEELLHGVPTILRGGERDARSGQADRADQGAARDTPKEPHL